ncbi:hypothetical protein EDD18DRAFT_1104545 [Armillaria luteobubalina]|uniref:Uncharacterized protein n=1 Tax=Armillaria luteobubalina TaxID=153913 RepID=A0AA39Q874_9AGAR|nr:hypothetical protein EDD18DRAFT_1104545 [Armillaria luteobubalina]
MAFSTPSSPDEQAPLSAHRLPDGWASFLVASTLNERVPLSTPSSPDERFAFNLAASNLDQQAPFSTASSRDHDRASQDPTLQPLNSLPSSRIPITSTENTGVSARCPYCDKPKTKGFSVTRALAFVQRSFLSIVVCQRRNNAGPPQNHLCSLRTHTPHFLQASMAVNGADYGNLCLFDFFAWERSSPPKSYDMHNCLSVQKWHYDAEANWRGANERPDERRTNPLASQGCNNPADRQNESHHPATSLTPFPSAADVVHQPQRGVRGHIRVARYHVSRSGVAITTRTILQWERDTYR